MKLSSEEKESILEENQNLSLQMDLKDMEKELPKLTFRQYLDFLNFVSKSNPEKERMRQFPHFHKVIF